MPSIKRSPVAVAEWGFGGLELSVFSQAKPCGWRNGRKYLGESSFYGGIGRGKIGESSKQIGENGRRIGENGKNYGESRRQIGEGGGNIGGEARIFGECCRQNGERGGKIGDGLPPMGDDGKNNGGNRRPRHGPPRQDVPRLKNFRDASAFPRWKPKQIGRHCVLHSHRCNLPPRRCVFPEK